MQTKVVELDLNDVLPNRFQPRIKFSEESIQALSDSIKEHGVIQPIVVRTIGDKYEIIAGERRYKASVLAGKTTIPAIITDLNEKDSAEVAIIENVQRKDLTPIEEAISYKKILDMGYLTQDSLALKLGKTQSTIANKLRLLNLDDDVQEALLNEKISERHARSLLKLDTHEKQRNLLNRIINERLTVRKTDEEIDKMMNNENVEIFNFGVPTEPIKENNEETLEIFNPNVQSESVQTQDSIPELFVPIEPKPTTSFFNPGAEVINSTVPPVSLDMFEEVKEIDNSNPIFIGNTAPVESAETPALNEIKTDVNNMSDIFTEKPLANIDSLLQSNTSAPQTVEKEETNEDILVPGRFFNILQDEEEPQEFVQQSNLVDIASLNEDNSSDEMSPIDSFLFENKVETKPMESNFFNFELADTLDSSKEEKIEIPTVEVPNNEEINQVEAMPLFNFDALQESTENTEETVVEDYGQVPEIEIPFVPTQLEEVKNESLEIPSFPVENNTASVLEENVSNEEIMVSENQPSVNANNAINLVRKLADDLAKLGYVIDLDEFDFENMYQIVFKINK